MKYLIALVTFFSFNFASAALIDEVLAGGPEGDVRTLIEAFQDLNVQVYRGDDTEVRPIYVSAQ